MWILLITASAFSPLMETINSCDILHNVDFNFFEAFGLYEIMEISSSKMRPMVSGKLLFYIFSLIRVGLL